MGDDSHSDDSNRARLLIEAQRSTKRRWTRSKPATPDHTRVSYDRRQGADKDASERCQVELADPRPNVIYE